MVSGLHFLFAIVSIICCSNTVNCLNRTCTSDAICNQGLCKNNTCTCLSGYISYNNSICNYQQKQQLVAFLLSFLVGTCGADWFYLSQGNGGYIAAGVIKLMSGLVGIFAPCCMCCFGLMRSDKAKVGGFLVIIVGVSLAAALQSIWWLADWIRVIVGTFKDGNDQNLASW
jgi:hypothetical protein